MSTIVSLKRFLFLPKQTIGEFHYSFNTLWSLEDCVRGNGDPKTVATWKIKGETAIPYGVYELEKRYSQAKGQPRIYANNVPGYQGIQIHAGNTEKDTEGCPIIAYKFMHIESNNSAYVLESKKAMLDFYAWFDKQKEKVFLEVSK